MAIPQCGAAQFGSLAATSRNSFSAAEYANECKSATARSKLFCTLLEHEVGNWTLPSFSGAGWSCSGMAASACQSPDATKTKKTSNADITRTIGFRGVTTLVMMRLLWMIQFLIASDNFATDYCHHDLFDLPGLTLWRSSDVIGCHMTIFEST